MGLIVFHQKCTWRAKCLIVHLKNEKPVMYSYSRNSYPMIIFYSSVEHERCFLNVLNKHYKDLLLCLKLFKRETGLKDLLYIYFPKYVCQIFQLYETMLFFKKDWKVSCSVLLLSLHHCLHIQPTIYFSISFSKTL